MKTKQLYLEDSYLKTMTALILEVYPETQGKWKVVLSETVFYPMGGGQPTDQGTLSCENWHAKVYQVLAKGDTIFHYIEAESAPVIGLEVRGKLDWARRYHNMRLHSAGHVIDFAIYLLGYSPKSLTPLKADHGKKPTIWYQGTIEGDFREELEVKANSLIAQNLRFSTQLASYEKLKEEAIYLQPNLPTNKQLRLLELETVGVVADGGTQVHFTKEVGHIRILSIEAAEGMTMVRYAIEEDK